MKIVFVVPSLRKGGAERVVSNLSNYLHHNGHEIVIVLLQDEVEYDVDCKVVSLNSSVNKNIIAKIFGVFSRSVNLRKIIKIINPEQVISFTETANFPTILSGVPVTISVRNFPSEKLTYLQKVGVFFLYRLPNVKNIVAVSKAIEENLIAKFKLKNVTTIYNPIIFSNESDNSLPDFPSYIAPGKYWLAVGRLNKQKGFDRLILAYHNCKYANTFPLVILGRGSEEQNLKELINKYKLENRVFLLEPVDNIEKWYSNCYSFVLSSRFEGFPNVLIEALSQSAACIAVDCHSGPSEIITDGLNGVLIEPSISKLSDSLDFLSQNENIKNDFSKVAKSSISHLNIESISTEWLELK